MPLTMFGSGSSLSVTLHLPDCARSVADAPGANRVAGTGAVGLIVIGSSLSDLAVPPMAAAGDEDMRKPTLIGGGATADNLREALPASDGVIDSCSRLRKGIDSDDPLSLNADLRRCVMDQARDT